MHKHDCPRGCLVLAAIQIFAIVATAAGQTTHPASVPALSHPRLYFTPSDLPALRAMRSKGLHKNIWTNMQASADWALTLPPRRQWIAPVTPDPIYENLYDRFYAIMRDLAVTEHLAFTYALSGDERYGEAARQWTLASCRAWKAEATGKPDGGKAYAVTRLLKGVAVGYDAAYDRFTESERNEIRDTLVSIARSYFDGYFTTPTIAGESFHTHHAIVEWSSFGVTALALLGETPEAQRWLDATTKKFEQHLLPLGLAADGAQVEGATFYASTMQYRLAFMDALRRVTGRDLFPAFAKQMNTDFALASIAGEHPPGFAESNQSVVLSPSYGQLDYLSPVLFFLAREYHRPICQRLALWDHSAGAIQRTRYITPHGEQLLFALGCYSFVWLDESAATKPPAETKLSFGFASIDEAYLRASWNPGDLLIGVRKGELVIHGGGNALLVDPAAGHDPLALKLKSVSDDGALASIVCSDDKDQQLTVELHRPDRAVVRRRISGDWRWSCQGEPVREANKITWPSGASIRVTSGTISKWEPDGYAPLHAVGFEKLKLVDPAPRRFPRCTISPSPEHEVVIEVTRR